MRKVKPISCLSRLLMFGVSLFIVSCSSIQTGSHSDESISIEKYKSFSWIAPDPMVAQNKNSIVVSPLSKKHIESAIKQALIDKGYVFRPTDDKVDFVISYSVGTRERVEVDSYPGLYRGDWSWYWQGEVHRSDKWHVQTWTEGTLTIDIFDNKLKEPVWHGWATKAVTQSDRQKPSDAIEEAIKGIFKEFPVSR